MRFFCCCVLIAVAQASSTVSYGDSSEAAKRDAALKGIDACIRRNEASSRECKSLNKHISTLEDLYRNGDKTVLPTLLRFTYLTDFFGESLIADPNTFLMAVSRLPEQAQQLIGDGIAGGMFGLPRPRFDAIRANLMNVSASSPAYQLARKSLAILETDNACSLVDYFPPQTFDMDPRDLLRRWYSRVLYASDEKPLREYAREEDSEVYRIMILPTWGNPIVLRMLSHNKLYALSARRLGGQAGYDQGKLVEARDIDLSADDSRELDALIRNVDLFQMPTNDNIRGLDGDEWILEGVSQGKYHLVQRWCAEDYHPEKRNLKTFLALCRFLIDKSALSERPKNKGHRLL